MIHEGYHKGFSADSSSEVLHKGAGDGWGGGRGKVNNTSNISVSSSNFYERVRPHGGAQPMNNTNVWLPRNNVQHQGIKYWAPPGHQGRGQHSATGSPTSAWIRSSATSFVPGRGRR
jgi:hypothetical protein